MKKPTVKSQAYLLGLPSMPIICPTCECPVIRLDAAKAGNVIFECSNKRCAQNGVKKLVKATRIKCAVVKRKT